MNILLSITLTASLLAATPGTLKWSGDYGAALKSAQSNARPLLIMLDKPGDSEHRFSPVRLSSGPIGRSLLSKYELCHVDVTTPYGEKVAAAFKTTEFPMTLIIDRTGKRIVYRKVGQISDEDWASTLQEYQEEDQPANCFT